VSENDQALIDRCLAGDAEAFSGLVERHQDRLYGTLVHVLGSPQDALDVAQEAFVLAYQNLNSFRGDSAFYSWLYRIAHNAAVSFRRRGGRTTKSLDRANELTGLEPMDESAGANPAGMMEAEERRRLVHVALGELPEEQRSVLVLKELEGMSYEEIAEALDCPIGTVRSRIHRARGELRDRLERAMKTEQ
jgi:RNA polymerase sigma-70 factor (ECF subfamily)